MKKARRFADGLVRSWSGRRGSNPRPRPWQGRALPAEPRPHRRGNIILEVSVARNPRFQKSSQKYFRNLSLMVGELLVDYLLADAENFQSSKHSWAISSGGEHYLDTVGVTSSNLVSPTMNSRARQKRLALLLFGESTRVNQSHSPSSGRLPLSR